MMAAGTFGTQTLSRFAWLREWRTRSHRLHLAIGPPFVGFSHLLSV